MKNVFISIIIPTKNEEKNITPLLRSINFDKYLKKEVIIVDNFSSDNTIRLAKQFGAKVYKKGSERSAQRNFGAHLAKGKYILFLDADMRLTKGLLASLSREASLLRKAIIISEKSEGTGYWARVRSLERATYVGDSAIECPRFFERDLFLSLGGYNPKLYSGEDFELKAKLQQRKIYIGRVGKYIIHEEGKLSLRSHLHEMRYYGRNEGASFHTRGFSLATLIQISPIRPSFFRNWHILTQDPLHAIGIFVLKFLEFGAVGSSMLFQKKK